MNKSLLTITALLISLSTVFSQTNIDIDIKNYDSDSLILGYYLADKLLVKDTLIRDAETEKFSYSQDSLLEEGVYLIVSIPEGLFYQVLIGGEGEQEFQVLIDTTTEQEIFFSQGSKENELFYSYLNFVNASRSKMAEIERVIADTDSVMVSIRDQLFKDQQTISYTVELHQRKVVEENPNSITALLVGANLPFNFPTEFTGTEEEIQTQRYLYYREHYFDNINMDHPALIRTPVIDQRVNYYMDNLTTLEPDSIIVGVDRILGLLQNNEDAYRFYLSQFLNKYGNSKYIGMDAVYVHLALEYYDKGKAPWVSQENKEEIVSNAKKIAPILIGKTAPDFTTHTQEGTPITLSERESEYTVLVFWKPNCGHCTKAMPHVIEFNEKWKSKGVETITICTKTGKDFDTCWEDVEKKGMQDLINTGDQYQKSRILSKYYATSTPKIFIIDKDQKIVIKKVPAENLDAVLVEISKPDIESDSTGN